MTAFNRAMAIAVALTAMLAASAANATIVLGTFTGTLNSAGGGTDPAGNDWSGAALTGTLSYDTDLFTPSISPDGTMNTATGTGVGALTATITIGSFTHTFTDQTSSSIYLDTGASQVTYTIANTRTREHANTRTRESSVSEFFSLDAFDAVLPFRRPPTLDKPSALRCREARAFRRMGRLPSTT